MRTYGKWWLNLPSSRNSKINLPHGTVVESQDFIEFRVGTRVVPLLIRIYEVYNPGAIVKFLGFCYETEKWITLWKGPPQYLFPNAPHCFTAEIQAVNFLSDYYRIEFHHKHLSYYYELDGLILYGEDKFPLTFPSYNLCKTAFPNVFQKMMISSVKENETVDVSSSSENYAYFDALPNEVIHLIVSYLDLKSLCLIAQVSKLLQKVCYDPVLYKDVNLQLYWPLVNVNTLKGFESRFKALKTLNLSWCGSQGRILPSYFIIFLESICQHLTSLKLSSCSFINNNCLKAIASHCLNLQELQLSSCRSKELTQTGFKYISQMKNLTHLDLYRTLIDKSSIISIINSVPLEHLFLGSCTNIDAFNEVARAIGNDLKNIKTLDFWRASSLSCLGVGELAENCNELIEIDLGWCHRIDASCGCIRQLITRCTKLKKLFLSVIRTLSIYDLYAISSHSQCLEQLDLLGTRDINAASVKNVLQCCKKLKLLDVSYCDPSVLETVFDLRLAFPDVEIKCSTPIDLDM